MAKFLVLIYGDELRWNTMSADESRAHDAAHVAFSKAAGKRIINGEELESTVEGQDSAPPPPSSYRRRD